MALAKNRRRTRVERGVYRQPNGNYAVCARLHFRTVGRDLAAARRVREELVTTLAAGRVPASPRLRFDTVAGWWLERFEAKVAAGERHPRTLETHRYHLDHNGDGWPPLRFHDLRHTFASHLIVDLGLDVAQVSRILGHARITITLDVYTHLFDGARHTREIRRRMAASQFASLLDPDSGEAPVTMLSHSMRGRAGLSDRSTEPTPALPPFAQRGSAMPGDQGSCNAWDAESGWPCNSESGGLPMPRSMSNL